MNSNPIYKFDKDVADQVHIRRHHVSEGVDLILSLFQSVGPQRIFPRAIMTKTTNGQLIVYSKEQILYWFERANYQDCRINAYPAFLSNSSGFQHLTERELKNYAYRSNVIK